MRGSRGGLLLGPPGGPGRRWAGGLLAVCVIMIVVLGVAFRGQTRADGFDSAVDSPFITFFAGHRNLLLWFAFPGTLIPAVVISAAIAVWCLYARRLNGAVLAVTAVPIATGLDDRLLKHVFDRTYRGALVFPSGHTTSIVTLTAALAVLLLVPPRQGRIRWAREALLAVFCVAAAVVIVGVIALRWHYFTDTVAGAAIGLGTVCSICLILDLAWSRWRARAHAPDAVASAAGHPHGRVP